VTDMGGKVAKKLGDGLMALFGYPVAQENDAERAVRAGLAIQRSLTELNRKNEGTGKPALAARAAIDVGPVVVDATGEIFGDVPNVAARAQALAEPNTVVVTARVQRQVAGLFVAEERGSHELKGVPERYPIRESASPIDFKASFDTLDMMEGNDASLLPAGADRAAPGRRRQLGQGGWPDVAKYRHVQLSAVRLSGDLNAKVDSSTLEELLAKIREEYRKLGPLIDEFRGTRPRSSRLRTGSKSSACPSTSGSLVSHCSDPDSQPDKRKLECTLSPLSLRSLAAAPPSLSSARS